MEIIAALPQEQREEEADEGRPGIGTGRQRAHGEHRERDAGDREHREPGPIEHAGRAGLERGVRAGGVDAGVQRADECAIGLILRRLLGQAAPAGRGDGELGSVARPDLGDEAARLHGRRTKRQPHAPDAGIRHAAFEAADLPSEPVGIEPELPGRAHQRRVEFIIVILGFIRNVPAFL